MPRKVKHKVYLTNGSRSLLIEIVNYYLSNHQESIVKQQSDGTLDYKPHIAKLLRDLGIFPQRLL